MKDYIKNIKNKKIKKNQKKGFTLIEIIIVIALIAIIGVGSTFGIVLTKKNNDMDSVNKRILEAAMVYINVEKGDDGKLFINGIQTGRRGIKIPLTTLVEKGYVDKKDADKAYKTQDNRPSENADLFVLIADGENAPEYCSSSNPYTVYGSWMDKRIEPIYLCPPVEFDATSDGGNGTMYTCNMTVSGVSGTFNFFEDKNTLSGASGICVTGDKSLNSYYCSKTKSTIYYIDDQENNIEDMCASKPNPGSSPGSSPTCDVTCGYSSTSKDQYTCKYVASYRGAYYHDLYCDTSCSKKTPTGENDEYGTTLYYCKPLG